jgi:hypothetical protein
MIVEIAVSAGGISKSVRRVIQHGVILIAATSVTVSAAVTMRSTIPAWAALCYLCRRLDSAVAIAWLVAFVIVAAGANLFSDWTTEARGIVCGLSLELSSASYISWLSVRSVHLQLLADVKSIVYLFSLIVWVASTGPRPNSEETAENSLTDRLRAISHYHRASARPEVIETR